MHEYPYFKPDAGVHMVSEPETRAIMEWIIAHRNVAAILTFGESDNLIVPPHPPAASARRERLTWSASPTRA